MSPSGRNKHYSNGLFLIFHHSKVQPTITQPSTHTHLLHPENLLAVPLWTLVIRCMPSNPAERQNPVEYSQLISSKRSIQAQYCPYLPFLLSSNVKNSGYDISSHLFIIIISIGSNFIETGWNVKICSATI